MRGSVYLSGPITGLAYEGCTDWRDYARKRLADMDIDGLCPMRGKDYLRGKGEILDGMQAVIERALSQDAAIVTRDRWDTTRCDFVLVNLLGAKAVSIGTVIEIAWADMARKPVVLVMEPSGNPHEHAFIRELNGYRVETLDEALDIVGCAMARHA